MPIQHVRAPDDDWAALDTASGGNRPEIVRALIRWYLRRPGARLPDRPTAQDWAAVREAAALDWFRELGHDVSAELAGDAGDGRQWTCSRCGDHVGLTSKGKRRSSNGTTPCPGAQGDTPVG